MTGIEITLQQLTRTCWKNRLDPAVYRFARRLTDREASRQAKMAALVAELHRTDHHAPSPVDSETMTVPLDADRLAEVPLEADYACLFVASGAMSVGIRCRLVAARYGQSWTCWVSYEVGDHWETVDPLRQRPERGPDEQVLGPIPGET